MTSAPLLLAMHSCTDRFGLALQDPQAKVSGSLVRVFDDGRGLSNTLINRVCAVLPASRWSSLQGLAVSTGPGGFTGTRLSVVMARTLAQQLDCPLLGVSSYALMAARLHRSLPSEQQNAPFWITQELPRRGTVGGCYRFKADGQVEELSVAHLLPAGQSVEPAVEAIPDVAADVERLLLELGSAIERDADLPWASVLPIYPTSPVGLS